MNGTENVMVKNLLSAEGRRDFVLLIAIGLFMAAIGAFDTNAAAIGRRLAYWLALMMLAGGTHRILNAHVASPSFANDVWRKSALLATLMTVVLTPIVWLFSALIFGAELSAARFMALMPGVLVVNGALVMLLGVTQQRKTSTTETSPPTKTIPEAIGNLMPAHLRQSILHAIQADDHYLHIHTSMGSALIRMTMRDAIGALDPEIGFQTHRSWWVNETSIRDVCWKRGRATLLLDHDIEVPVSRTFAKKLVAAKRL